MSGDVEKWVEEGARAMPHADWDSLHPGQIARYRSDASACLRAFLTAAEADGVVLVRVPEQMDWRKTDGPAQGMKTKGWNDCRAAILAGKVTV